MIQILPDKKRECCGCNACIQICPKACISMEEDREGFWYPKVDPDQCIGCNLCEKVCPIREEKKPVLSKEEKKPKAIGGWHKNENVRFDSSSGGAFTLFAEYILNQGGVVYGSTLKEDFHAAHIGVERVEDLKQLRGSKYIPSDIAETYKEVRESIKKGRKVLFVGTPCQCAGLHRFLKVSEVLDNREHSNLFICDFICHGVPSPKVFKRYIEYLEKKYQDKMISFRFRNKDRGWNSTGLQMGTESEFLHVGRKRFVPAFRDAYMNGFLDDLYLRPSCYCCKFKCLPKNYADITIADFWGVKKVAPELCDGKGTSLVLLHNEHGQELFDLVKENFFHKEVDFQAAIHRNKSLIRSAKESSHRGRFFYDYERKPFEKVMQKYMSAFTWAFHKVMKLIWSCLETIIKVILNPILKLFRLSFDDSDWEGLFQFIKFAMVGISNVAVSYTINVSTLFFLQRFDLKFDYMIANVTAFVLSVLWSYHWNSRYVFHPDQKEKHWRIKTLVKTYVSYAFSGIVLNNVLATLWIRVLGISKYLSPLLNLPFSMPVNFFMQKLWAYKEKRKNS